MSDRISRIRQFLLETPDDLFLNHALALEHLKAGDEAEALRIFEENRRRDAAYVGTYYHLGKAYERAGRTADATEAYEVGLRAARAAGDARSASELQAAYDDLL